MTSTMWTKRSPPTIRGHVTPIAGRVAPCANCPSVKPGSPCTATKRKNFAAKGGRFPARRLRQRGCLSPHRMEARRELAGRAVDDLQSLGHRRLAGHRLVALGRPRIELPPQCSHVLTEIGQGIVRHRIGLPPAIICDDTLLPAPPPARARRT